MQVTYFILSCLSSIFLSFFLLLFSLSLSFSFLLVFFFRSPLVCPSFFFPQSLYVFPVLPVRTDTSYSIFDFLERPQCKHSNGGRSIKYNGAMPVAMEMVIYASWFSSPKNKLQNTSPSSRVLSDLQNQQYWLNLELPSSDDDILT